MLNTGNEWLLIQESISAHFLTPLKGSSLLSFLIFTLLKNHHKSAEKSHTVSDSSIRFYPKEIPPGSKTFGLTRFTVTLKDFAPSRFQRDQSGVAILRNAPLNLRTETPLSSRMASA
jgi:hypothetical protein